MASTTTSTSGTDGADALLSSMKAAPSPYSYAVLSARASRTLDKTIPFFVARWLLFATALLAYCVRVYVLQGFYIVSYTLGIYLLNQLIHFLTPQADPELDDVLGDDGGDDDGDDVGALPQSASAAQDGEFKGFVRRLSEFKFWLNGMRALLIALACTLFALFDVPVMWEILLFYFITLFAITMKKRIRHMIKYRYVPWSSGKKTYAGKEQTL